MPVTTCDRIPIVGGRINNRTGEDEACRSFSMTTFLTDLMCTNHSEGRVTSWVSTLTLK
jgi:hypothetical protein